MQERKQMLEGDIAGIAGKARKESAYHLRHSRTWVLRLGDGTEESHSRMQAGLDTVWRFSGEMFIDDDVDRAADAAGYGVLPSSLRSDWLTTMFAFYVVNRLVDFEQGLDDCLALWLPVEGPDGEADVQTAHWAASHFDGRAWLAANLSLGADDRGRRARLTATAASAGNPQ